MPKPRRRERALLFAQMLRKKQIPPAKSGCRMTIGRGGVREFWDLFHRHLEVPGWNWALANGARQPANLDRTN
jgi:hypothetical protein